MMTVMERDMVFVSEDWSVESTRERCVRSESVECLEFNMNLYTREVTEIMKVANIEGRYT